MTKNEVINRKMNILGGILIVLTIILGVYSQLMLKWQVNSAGALPNGGMESILRYVLGLLTNFWVLTAFFSSFLAVITWMGALSQFELSAVYPFTAITFVAIMLLSAYFFQESLTPQKIVGTILVILGLIVATR
jgi:multidrug transporter EmrE-like cation transporter